MKYKAFILIFILLLAGAAVFIFSKYFYPSTKSNSFGQMLDAKWDLYETTKPGWHNGKSRQLKVIYFGFLSCPDVCPLALRNLQSALHELSEDELKRISAVFVSLDPERDTVQKLEETLISLHKEFIGVRPREDQIASLASTFMFHTEHTTLDESAIKYVVSHPNRFYFVDLENRLLEAVSESSSDGLVKRIRETLRSI